MSSATIVGPSSRRRARRASDGVMAGFVHDLATRRAGAVAPRIAGGSSQPAPRPSSRSALSTRLASASSMTPKRTVRSP